MGCKQSSQPAAHPGMSPVIFDPSEGGRGPVPVPKLQQEQQQRRRRQLYESVDDGNGNIFTDQDFPATLETITKDTKDQYYDKYKAALWRRPHEIMECDYNEIQVFDGIDIDDIEQGLIGNCYFLAALSGLAEVPERVRAIFQSATVNKNGKYGLKFYVQGVPTIIKVDDRFPCLGEGPYSPLFSKPKGKELWSILLEKAWAKLFKGYSNISTGTLGEALEYLTKAPSFDFGIEQESEGETWARLKHADEMNYTSCAASRADVQESTGIAEAHAYTIISAHEVEGYRLLRLRNPWGKFEWKGDFSDSSPLWTESLKEALEYEDADNGMFYMTVQDFRSCFSYYSIHRYYSNWHYSYLEQNSGPKHANYYKFSVDKPCEAYFRIHQKDSRSYDISEKKRINFKYSPASFMIVKVEKDGQYKLVFDSDVKTDPQLILGGRSICMTKDGKVHIKEAGDYIIRAKVYWRHGHEDTCTISAYSSREIVFKRIPSVKDFLTKYLTLVAKQNKEEYPLDDTCVQVNAKYGIYSLIMATNNGDKDFTTTLVCKKLKNLRLSKPLRVSKKRFTMTIAPGSSQLVFLKVIDPFVQYSTETLWLIHK